MNDQIEFIDNGRTTAASKMMSIEFINGETGVADEEIRFPTRMPLIVLWELYTTVQEIGLDRAVLLVNLGAHIGGASQNSYDYESTRYALQGIRDMAGGGKPIRALEEYIFDETLNFFAFCYALLKARELTHAEAAEFALEAIGKHYTTEAWRVALGRWIDRMGLERVGQRKPKS